MTKRAGLRSLIATGLMTCSTMAYAGAWTQEEGKGELIVTTTAMQANRVFTSGSALRPIPAYTKAESQALIEYGVTGWLTAMIGPSLQHVDIAPPFGAVRDGLGYTDLGLRAKVWSNDSTVVSVQGLARLPGTEDRTNVAAIGYTDPELELRGMIGHSFKVETLPSFVDVQVAQRFRLGGPPDEFRADATFGIRPVEKWLLLAQSFNVISEGAGTWGFGSFAYHKLQLSAVYALTPTLSLQLGAYSTYWGRNALQENGMVAGAWVKF